MIRTVCFICFRSPFSYFSATLASPYVKLFFPSRGLPRRRPRNPAVPDLHSGDHGRGETHVPIPNTLVKPPIADGSATTLSRESRSSPVLWPAPSARRARVFFNENQTTSKNLSMGNLKKKRRLKMNKHKRRKRTRANRHKKRDW